MALDAAKERGIRQPAIPATATVMATATATDGKHWVAGGVTSGGSGNGILLWRITQYWENIILSNSKLAQKVRYFFSRFMYSEMSRPTFLGGGAGDWCVMVLL